MIYNFMDKGGLLQVKVEKLIEKYGQPSVKYVMTDLKASKDIITDLGLNSRPFFGTRWLVIIQNAKINSGVLKALVGNRYTDVLFLCTSMDSFNTYKELAEREISKVAEAVYSGTNYNDFLMKINKDKVIMPKEREKQIRIYLKRTRYVEQSVYDLSREYLMRYTYWLIREKKYSEDLMRDTWYEEGSEAQQEYKSKVLRQLSCRVKGNETRYTSVISLYGETVFTLSGLNEVMVMLPEHSGVYVSNLPMNFFRRDPGKRNAVVNCIYKFRKSPVVLHKHFEEFFDKYSRVYGAYVRGELSVVTKLEWFKKNRRKYKIWSEYALDQWWNLIHRYSYETMCAYREGLERAYTKSPMQFMYKLIDLYRLLWGESPAMKQSLMKQRRDMEKAIMSNGGMYVS